jgi:hypothetical protein
MLFDGTGGPIDGALVPERDRTGHGLTLRTGAAEFYRVA